TERNQLQQATTGVVVLVVALEMFGEVGNALGEDGNLHFRRTGIVRLGCVFLDQSGLALGSDRHRVFLSKKKVDAPAGMSSRRGQWQCRPERSDCWRPYS